MTATAIPTRMLVLLGVILAAAAAFLVARPILLSSDDGSSSATPASTKPATTSSATTATPSEPAARPAAKPALVLVPGLPTRVAGKLHHSNVVVVSVYSATAAGDRNAVVAARKGAKDAGVAFAALNVLDESTALQLEPWIGMVSPPVVLVVRRPGSIVQRFDKHVDEKVVAQAALNARPGGAAKRAASK